MNLQFLPEQRKSVKVQSHNEHQSNRVMNRRLMAVKGRQAKLRDPHDTTRVVNVSISASPLSASHRIRPKNANGEADDYQRRRQNLVRGKHESRRRLRRPRPPSDLWEANSTLAP